MNRSSVVVVGAVLVLSVAPVQPCPNDEARTAPVGGYVKKTGVYLPPSWLRQTFQRTGALVRDARPHRDGYMRAADRFGILTGGSKNR